MECPGGSALGALWLLRKAIWELELTACLKLHGRVWKNLEAQGFIFSVQDMVGEPESSFDTLRIFYLIALALAWQKLDPSWSHSLLDFKISWTSLGFLCESWDMYCKTGTPDENEMKAVGKDQLTSSTWTPRSRWDPLARRNVLSPGSWASPGLAWRPCSVPPKMSA